MQSEPSVWTRATWLACLVALAGCQGGGEGATEALNETAEASPETELAPGATPLTAAPFDVADAVERARAAFFEHDGMLVAGLEPHGVDVAPDGDRISVTPSTTWAGSGSWRRRGGSGRASRTSVPPRTSA